MKCRRKSPVVEAQQWFPGRIVSGVVPFPDELRPRYLVGREDAWIETSEGGRLVKPGDWIITHANGEKQHCRQNEFAEEYEAIEEQAIHE